MSIATDQELTAQSVSKHFGGVKALDGVDLQLRPGQIHALIGPNGAGKSTMIHVLSGFLAPDGGRVCLGTQDLGGLGPQDRVARGVVRTFQEVRGFPELTVAENVLIGAHLQLPKGLLAPVVAPRRLTSILRHQSQHIQEILAAVGLGEDRDVTLATLPFGKQRLMGLARAMAAMPRVILLDEPGAGLHHEEMRKMVEAISQLRRQHVAILLVEHHMSMIEALADVVTVLDFGRTIAHGQWADVRLDPQVMTAYLGRRGRDAGGT